MLKKRYIIGNAQDVAAIVKKAKVLAPQLIISSPPYFDLLNYDNNKEQIGYGEKDYDKYLDKVCKVFQDCYDISAPNSTFWLIVDTFKKNREVTPFPFDIVNKLKAKAKKTWILKDVIIWDKDKNHPFSGKGNFKNQYEYRHEHIFYSKDVVNSMSPIKDINTLVTKKKPIGKRRASHKP